MEVIFNKYYVLDNVALLWCYVILIILVLIITILLVRKELRNKK